jgi:ribonuclease T2
MINQKYESYFYVKYVKWKLQYLCNYYSIILKKLSRHYQMNKLFLICMFFTVSLLARHDAYPTKECPAFNNMKHSKNTHAVHLDTKQKYTILKHHKGQTLVLIKGEQPAQRWVDEGCFPKSQNGSNPMNVKEAESEVASIEDELRKASKSITSKRFLDSRSKSKMTVSSKQNILALSWHNAFCETHRYKKECKRSLLSFGKGKYREKHFVLHGLWPQPKSKIYCNVEKDFVSADKHGQWRDLPCLAMDEKTEERLAKVMPGFASDLHKHEWVKHGTCYGTDPQTYFEDAVSMVEQMNTSKVGAFFSKHIGKGVTLKQVRAVFDRSFGVGAGKRVELKCKNGLVTELWLHLGSGSDDLGVLLKKGKQIRSRCQKGFIDKAGFGR